MGPTSKWLFVPRVPKSPRLGLLQLWGAIILRADLWLKWGLKQSCSPRQNLSNGMSHVICTHGNRVESRLLVVGNQIANLTPGLSFGHNLCFRCPNEQCELILDMYVLRPFQWYKKLHKKLSFDPWNRSLKFWESIGIPSPKVGVALGVWRFTPSHFPTLLRVCDVIPRLSLGLHPYNPFALVASPKLGLRHCIWKTIDQNLFFLLFILFIIGWLGFLRVFLKFCCDHDLILK
jgi:hypothetical protein